MAKKPARKAKRGWEKAGKVGMQVRFDADVHARISAFCETMGVSVNQWLQGVAKWAIDHAVQGEPIETNGELASRDRVKCCWFGRVATYGQGEYLGRDDNGDEGYEDGPCLDKGRKVFTLDFSDRGYIPGE